MRATLAFFLFALVVSVGKADSGPSLPTIVDRHVLTGYSQLEATTRKLAQSATANCAPSSEALRSAFHESFDAWLGVSHLRFGPSEVDNRAFALAFWPDPRNKTRKALARLVAARDPIIQEPSAYKTLSVAARGFFALEILLFDSVLRSSGDAEYFCALTRAIASDVADTAREIAKDWRDDFKTEFNSFGGHYRTEREARQEFFKALSTGLQFVSEARLGRPLGAFERPRPRRAEMRLSKRSLRNVNESLDALRDLASQLASNAPETAERLGLGFDAAREAASKLIEDPVFSSVADVQGRLRVEVLQQRVDNIRRIVGGELAPALGVGQGFNALDGD
ncbi:MAG: imelysin family protein [Pseudomonadota bacterium]